LYLILFSAGVVSVSALSKALVEKCMFDHNALDMNKCDALVSNKNPML
jgi:hypothetical protein